MATITNKSLNTGSMTNKELKQSLLLVADATFLVGNAIGTVGTPYGINNKVLNTGSMTNKSIS